VIKVCTKFERNRAIPGWIIEKFSELLQTLCHAVTLTFDLLTVNFYSTSGVYAFKLCTKRGRNHIIHRRVIDHLAHFRRAILGEGETTDNRLSGMRWPNFTKLVEDMGDHSHRRNLFQRSGILTAFSKASLSKLCWKRRQIPHVLTPVKIMDGWARSLYQLLKLYLRTSEIHLMAIHCVAAEHGGLIKK